MELSDLIIDVCMERCVEVARKTLSNIKRPHVGVLVVSDSGKIVGEGYKKFVKGTSYVLHAERMALDNAGESAKGGYLFTTLEPCVKSRKHQVFSSCSELILESGITKVIIGLLDNSPSMKPGEGMTFLKKHGIEVMLHYNKRFAIKRELMPLGYGKSHNSYTGCY
ncbi:MAG: hypothetical protein ABH824_01715 [Nanoarchaeota archaeon]